MRAVAPVGAAANDSAAIRDYLKSIGVRPLVIGDVSIDHNKTLDFTSLTVTAAEDAACIFSLDGWASTLKNTYIRDARGAAVAVRFGAGGRGNRFRDSWILNARTAMAFAPGDAGTNDQAMLSNITTDTYEEDGLFVGPNVSAVNSSNLYLDSGIDIANSRPKRGTTGYRNIASGATSAVGGHLHSQMTAINTELGIHLVDAQLDSFNNCITDSNASYGLKIEGNSSGITFTNLYCGSGRGIYVGGGSSAIMFNGLETRANGLIPPWGGRNFYLPQGPVYDVTIGKGARAVIDGGSWRGDKRVLVEPGGRLVVTGGERRWLDSAGAVAGGTPVCIGLHGTSSDEGEVAFRMPFPGVLFSLQMVTDYAPGEDRHFTYTARVQGRETALVAVAAGADAYTTGVVYPPSEVWAEEGATVSVELHADSGAAAARHWGNLHFLAV